MKAMLVDTNWCFGCHSCEITCQVRWGMDPEQGGIRVAAVGPWSYDSDGVEKWQHDYVPIPTDQCRACWSAGEQPPCATVCQSQCLKFGEFDELAAEVSGPKQLVYALRE